jgi:alpha-beta hydrolase superfamily lysophospholipase
MTKMAAVSSLAGAPATLSYRDAPEVAAEHGTVLLYHGFGGSRERVGYYAAALAQAGFLAVSVDAVGHGERRLPARADQGLPRPAGPVLPAGARPGRVRGVPGCRPLPDA